MQFDRLECRKYIFKYISHRLDKKKNDSQACFPHKQICIIKQVEDFQSSKMWFFGTVSFNLKCICEWSVPGICFDSNFLTMFFRG